MLTGVNVVFIGGDARQLEVIKKFVEMDASISLIGFDNLESKFQGVQLKELESSILSEADAIILPIVGADDEGIVESIFTHKKIQLTEEYFNNIKTTAKIYTGMAKPYLKKLAKEVEVELIELLDRDDIAIYNSIPTVEGTLMMAIQNTDFTIHNSNAVVLGFGRTGISLARVLHHLGAHVKVGARRPEHLARIFEMGLQPFHIDEIIEKVEDADLIFNTIPQMILNAKVLSYVPHNALIIDLASKPGGTDFRYAEKRGIKAQLAPGLPGIVAPRTAGNIIANVLSKLVLEQLNSQGGD